MTAAEDIYIEQFIDTPEALRVVRFWDKDDGGAMIYCSLDRITPEYLKLPMMHPIGMQDDNNKMIYIGDLLKVIIETEKYGKIERIGVVRRQGLYACGIDYIDKNGKVTQDGDFIDEFYIVEKYIVGDIFNGVDL